MCEQAGEKERMVGEGVDENLCSGQPQPVVEWPPPPATLQLTNKDGTSCQVLFLTVEYVEDGPNTSYTSGLGGFPELERQVDPNMDCTGFSPSNPLLAAPVSPGSSYLNPPSLPTTEPGMIVLSDACQFASPDQFVVASSSRMYTSEQDADDDKQLLLLSSNSNNPAELVVTGEQACGDQRVELLLSNGTIAYGIAVESLDEDGTRVIQIPSEYLVASAPDTNNLAVEDTNVQIVENVQVEQPVMKEEDNQDDGSQLRAFYDTLKEQGLIIEPEELPLQSDLNNQMNVSLLNQTALTDQQLDSDAPAYPLLPLQKRFWCEECNILMETNCREHQINRKISDKIVPSRARATLPGAYLSIQLVRDAGSQEYGVFARKNIPKRTQFGPMEGVVLRAEDLPSIILSLLVLTVETETGEMKTLDVSNEHMSNWMRFVRVATPERPPNLLLSQLGASLFFTTTHMISQHQELLVWYSPSYASRRNLPPNPPPPEWPCSTCGLKLKSPNELVEHSQCHKPPSPPPPVQPVKPESVPPEPVPPEPVPPEPVLPEPVPPEPVPPEPATQVPIVPKKEESLTVNLIRRENQAMVANLKNDIADRKTQVAQKQWVCAVCGKKFQRPDGLKRHIKTLHSRENRYHCKLCHLSFSHPYNQYRHMKRAHENRTDALRRYESWSCSHCELTFSNLSLLNLHTLTHTAINVKQEENGEIIIPDDIQDFFMKPHEQVSCPQCFQHFSNRRKLAAHATEHGKVLGSKGPKFHCESCGRNYSDQARFKIHCELHKNDEKKPLLCDVCKKRFLTNSALVAHLKVHDVVAQWECPMCKEHFGNVFLLKAHVHTHAVQGLYHCPHCNKAFDEYSGIRKHVRAFHADRRFGCTKCSMAFGTQDKLRMHLLRHSEHREFLCADCGKQFKRKDKLKEHMKRVHLKEGEDSKIISIKMEKTNPSKLVVLASDYERYIYKCHQCMLGFKRRGMLVNHLANRHPDITPNSVPELNLPILKTTRDYFCQYCDKIYKSSSKRKAHILKNHPGLDLPMSNRQKGGVPEIPGLPNPTFSQTVGSVTTNPQGCQWCHKQYASKAKLLQHQRKKHNQLLAESLPPRTTSLTKVVRSLNVLDPEENNENESVMGATVKPQHKTMRTVKFEDIAENEPVPVALSANINNQQLMLNTNSNLEYDIDVDDDVSNILECSTKRSSYKSDNISSDLLSQAMSEIGVSLSDLRAFSSEGYFKHVQSPGCQDLLYTPYTPR